jgi:hypothetical protein
MQTITIKLKDESVDFIVDLLKRLKSVTELKIVDETENSSNTDLIASIRLPKGKPLISDFAGFWSDNPKTLEQIRDQAWKRI